MGVAPEAPAAESAGAPSDAPEINHLRKLLESGQVPARRGVLADKAGLGA